MKITQVEYSRLVTGSNYSNEKIGATAEVTEGSDPDEVLVKLQNWVNGRFSSREHLQDTKSQLEDQIYDLHQEKKGYEDSVKLARESWDRAREFLAKHGVDPKDIEQIPF